MYYVVQCVYIFVQIELYFGCEYLVFFLIIEYLFIYFSMWCGVG